jgi:hypothetical protein
MTDLSFEMPFWKPFAAAELNARRDVPAELQEPIPTALATNDKREMSCYRDCRKFFRVALNYLLLSLALLKIAEIFKTINYLEDFSKFGNFKEYTKKVQSKNDARNSFSNIACPQVAPEDNIFTAPTSSGRVLVAVFPYGPNNQIRGFRESIFLAKMLNR